MKFVFALLVIYLIATSFAATTKSKAKANAAASEAATKEAISSLHRLSSTKLGKTLIDTLQIELKVNAGTDPRPRISVLLKEIQEETQEQLDTLRENHDQTSQQHEDRQASLESSIENLEETIQEKSAQQVATAADLESESQAYNQAEANGEALQSQLAALEEARSNDEDEFNNESARRKRIINVLNQVIGFVNERLEQRENPSFLQKNNMLVEIRRKVMSSEFQSASAGWGKFISFLVTKALNKIKATPDDEAIDALSGLVNTLTDLVENQKELLRLREAIELSAVATYESNTSDLNGQIDRNNAALATAALAIANDQATLAELAADLEQAKNNLANDQSDLAADQAQEQQDDEQYSNSSSQRSNELEIIQEVIDIVNNQLTNLSAAVENAAQNAQTSED